MQNRLRGEEPSFNGARARETKYPTYVANANYIFSVIAEAKVEWIQYPTNKT